jgi:hypothetical protein
MAIKCQHNIIQFQIPVYDTIFVEVFQRQADLSSVKSISLASSKFSIQLVNLLSSFCPKLTTLDVQHKITTTDVLHDEINPCLCLETSVEIKQERMPLFICD